MSRITWIVVLVEGVFTAVGLGVAAWIGTPILEHARIDPRSCLLALAATVPPVVLVLWGMRTETPLFDGIRKTVRETIVPLFGSCSALEILFLSVMAGIGEEIFFRGLLQGSLARIVHPWIALAVVSALFGLAHYVSLGYAIVTGLLGLYMGMLLLVTGNLFVAIAVHALYDFVVLLFISRMTLSPAVEPG